MNNTNPSWFQRTILNPQPICQSSILPSAHCCPMFHGAFQSTCFKKNILPDVSLPLVSDTKDLNSDELQLGKLPTKCKSKRGGRKPSLISPEDKKIHRAEKNRKFAKESRDRKRKYIQDLETQVKELKLQIEIFQVKLQKYELIEKHADSLNRELHSTLVSVCREMYNNDQPLDNTFVFTETFKRNYSKTLEEQRLVLKQLIKAMLNIAMPLPSRISLWLSNNNIDFYDYENTQKVLGSIIPIEYITLLSNYTKEAYPNKDIYLNMQRKFIDTGDKIRNLMCQIVEFQKGIQNELENFGKFVGMEGVVASDPRLIEILAKVCPYLANIPELNDFTIYKLKDSDLR